MCNKKLFGLVLQVNSNNRLKPFNYYSYQNSNNYSMSFGLSNLKHLSFSSRKLCPLWKNTNFYRTSTSYSTSKVSRDVKIPRVTGEFRTFSTKRENDLPKLMDFPQVIWPSVFKTIRNWILSNFIIMRYFDNEFSLPDFVIGSKKAVEVVSGLISRGDVDGLTGLVTPEVIMQVRNSLNTFTLKQRQEFAFKAEDVYFCFPYEVGVMFPNEDKNEGENQSRFVEITMCYHVLLGLKELQDMGVKPPANMGLMPEYSDKIFICNYRFIREFTKGVQDDWTINAINHFKPPLTLP